MELYVARQPIFDANKAIVAYELLHREAAQSVYTQTDGDYATSNVIASNFLSLGLESLTSGKLAYINFTTDLLLSGVATLLPKEQLVIEILEDVEPTPNVLQACLELKRAGYTLALDDFVLKPDYEPILELVDIIKIDFRRTTGMEQAVVIDTVSKYNVRILAEKVETEQEFRLASNLGYQLFQGYFFAKPTIIATGTIPINKIGYLQLMGALNADMPDMKEIASAIESDVGLSLETIKLVNSVLFAHKQRINNIPQAVLMLGLEGIRKWVYLTALRKLGNTATPDVLINTSLIRSKFMELHAKTLGLHSQSHAYRLLGLFSLLDAITNHPFHQLLDGLNLADELVNILAKGDYGSQLGQSYLLMIAYEKGEWSSVAKLCEWFAVSMNDVALAYVEALRWFNTNYLKVA